MRANVGEYAPDQLRNTETTETIPEKDIFMATDTVGGAMVEAIATAENSSFEVCFDCQIMAKNLSLLVIRRVAVDQKNNLTYCAISSIMLCIVLYDVMSISSTLFVYTPYIAGNRRQV